jgi:hypothetical protein
MVQPQKKRLEDFLLSESQNEISPFLNFDTQRLWGAKKIFRKDLNNNNNKTKPNDCEEITSSCLGGRMASTTCIGSTNCAKTGSQICCLLWMMLFWRIPVVAGAQHEVFHARGSSFEIGVAYGTHFQTKLEQVVAFKTTVQHADVMAEWNDLAEQSRAAIQKYAPLYWQELLGISQGSGLTMHELLLLATEYEADMIVLPQESSPSSSSSSPSGKGCTGFVLLGREGNINCTSWIGQTNDDHPAYWAHGDWDVVLHLEVKELGFAPLLVYTHVGIPAYSGMNRARGVTWYYIDDGMRLSDNPHASFLPTTVLIRQLLYLPEGKDEIILDDYLQKIPKAVPNAFLILDHSFHNATTTTSSAVSIELSPITERCSLRQSSVPESFLVHANHVVHSAQMWQSEVRLAELDVGHKSIDRYQVLTERLWNRNLDDQTNTNPRSAATYFEILSTLPIYNDETLATVVMDPMEGCLYIRWYDKDDRHRTLSRKNRHTTLDYQRICFDVDPTNHVANLSFGAVS